MERNLCAVLVVLLLPAAVFAAELSISSIEIVKGELQQINIQDAPYGGAYGFVKLRLGFLEWYPDSLWMLPESSSVENFKYTGTSYTVPASLNMSNNCRTSIYYNSSLGYAFKTSVKESGVFCILADPGKYKFIAEY